MSVKHLRGYRTPAKTLCGYYFNLRGMRPALGVAEKPEDATCGRCVRLHGQMVARS